MCCQDALKAINGKLNLRCEHIYYLTNQKFWRWESPLLSHLLSWWYCGSASASLHFSWLVPHTPRRARGIIKRVNSNKTGACQQRSVCVCVCLSVSVWLCVSVWVSSVINCHSQMKKFRNIRDLFAWEM
jgi:hypothetical protein